MSLNNIDKSRALRTEDELLALVEAIHVSPGAQETNWLEWKRTQDLGSAEGRFTVSKAILGFANRSVQQAHLAFEGVAYMVVGVEPGGAPGVTAHDHATLGQRIKRYADGPRWVPHYVVFAGVTVLVIVIEAPRLGDRIHTLQKEFSNDKTRHQAGTIFHRGTAHTEPAGPKEIMMLEERLLAGARQPDLDLELVTHPDALTRLDVSMGTVQDWLSRHEIHVRVNSGAPPDPSPPRPKAAPQTPFEQIAALSDIPSGVGGAWLRNLHSSPEDRAKFDRKVRDYIAELQSGALASNVVRTIVRGSRNKVGFSIGNETEESVSGIQLAVIVPKDGLVVFTSPPSANPLPPIPKWPSFYDNMSHMAGPPALSHYDLADTTAGSVIETGDAFEVVWDVGNLRPGEWSDHIEMTVIAGPDAPEAIEIELIARAMDRRRNTTAKALLAVLPGTWTVDDFYVAEPEAR